ncbi:glycosyltransferase [Auraticoccus monumenti]|uniref:Glycosyltransferase, GT2 family n=1 Tax=Auraticoccus monumenti TaxID=675864 RepID=A0A1G6Z1I6_9ACTN|nr:glycosyltransferase [Auraticoccus monumenti]SDD96468.1 Glycosyltransferase, GT2 family [Auraticoccus monumenti]
MSEAFEQDDTSPVQEPQTEPAAAWAQHDDVDDAPVDTTGEHVIAVLVCHDSVTWLPSALGSLARLDPAPDLLVVVDNTPGDASQEALQQAVRDGVVDLLVDGERGFGFAEAVAAGLRAADEAAPTGADAGRHAAPATGEGPRRRWVWLLHDDVVAQPDVLGQLLRHVVVEDDLALTGPTLLVPSRANQPRRLWESGVSVSGTGREVALAEPGEVDQGQLDRSERVLGLSTCGLLVRRDAWDALGGLAPELPVFRDGVELGWRATRAGYRVATTPSALLVHRRVGRAGLRASSATSEHPAAVDRSLGMTLVASRRSGVAAALTGIRLVWGCLLRMVGFVLGKAPDRAADEWRAARRYLGDRDRRARLRRRAAEAPVADTGEQLVDRLRPPWWHSLRVGAEWTAAAVSDRVRELTGRPDTSLDELTGDDFAGREDVDPPWWRTPLLVLVVVVAVGGLFGRWIAPGLLTSTQLLPGASTFTGTWSRYLDPGTGWLAAPWQGLLALLATPLGGRTDWLLVVLVAGGVLLALAAARSALRTLGLSPAAVLWGSAAWALLPTLVGAQQRGSLLVVGWAVALPLLVVAVHRLLRGRGLEATRGAFGVALALTVLAALAPLVLLPAAVLALLVALRRADLRLRVLVSVGVPLLLLAPWAPTLLARPGRWLTGPEPVLADQAAPTWWRMLLGQTPGAAWFDGGPVPLWLCGSVVGLLWLLALLGLARRPADVVVRASWVAAVGGFLLAVLVSRLVVAVPPAGDLVRPEPSGWLLLALGGLLVAAGRGLAGVALPGTARRLVSVVAALALLVVGTAWWAFDGATGPAERRQTALPAFIEVAMAETPVRTLAVDLGTGEPRWNLLSGDGPRTGDAETGDGLDPATRDEVAAAVARLVTTGGDQALADRLSRLGVGYLWVRGADPATLTAVGTTPGLQVGSSNEGTQVWTVTGTAPDRATGSQGPGGAAVAVAVLQLLGLLVVVVMAAPALSREVDEEPVARRGHTPAAPGRGRPAAQEGRR